jgi:hypothetical protein
MQSPAFSLHSKQQHQTSLPPPPRIWREEEVAAVIVSVSAKKEEWASLPVAEKLSLLRQCQSLLQKDEQWVDWSRGSCKQVCYSFGIAV